MSKNLALRLRLGVGIEPSDDKFKSKPDAFYKQFPNYKKPIHDVTFMYKALPKLKKDLKRIDVYLFLITWNIYSPTGFEQEYAHTDISKLIPDKDYIFTTDKNIYKASVDGYITFQWDVSPDKWEEVTQIFKEYFPGHTNGITNIHNAISVHMDIVDSNIDMYFASIRLDMNVPKKSEIEIDNSFLDIIRGKLDIDITVLSFDAIMLKHTVIDVQFPEDKLSKFKKNINKLLTIPKVVGVKINYITDKFGTALT